MSTKAALLQALLPSPGYGKDLIERIKTKTRGAVELGLGSVYPALRQLEDEGMIAKASMAGRASIYKLTANGKSEAKKDKKTIAILFDLTA